MVILGAASGALSLLLLVFFSDFHPGDRTRVIARLQIPGSLASVIFPLLAGLLLARAAHHFGEDWGWRVVLLGCVPVFLVLLALMPAGSLGRRGSVDSLRLRDLVEVSRRPMFLSLLIIGLLHTSADNATFLWLIMMVKQRFGASPAALGVLAAAYALAYTCGRLVRGTVRWPVAPLPTIAGGSVVGATILIATVRAPTLAATIALYAVAGLFLSLNYPSILGYAGERFPDRAGTVLGAISSVSAPGTAVASVVVGLVSRFAGSITVGILVPIGVFFALAVFTAAVHLRRREPE